MDNANDLLIDALGGTTAVATGIHAPTSTVHSWRTNGIPKSRLEHMKLVFTGDDARAAFDRFEVGADHVAPDTTGPLPPSSGNQSGSTAQAVA